MPFSMKACKGFRRTLLILNGFVVSAKKNAPGFNGAKRKDGIGWSQPGGQAGEDFGYQGR